MDIKSIIKATKKPMKDVAKELGITDQGLNTRLKTNMSLEIAKQTLGVVGYKIIAVPKDKPVMEGEYTL